MKNAGRSQNGVLSVGTSLCFLFFNLLWIFRTNIDETPFRYLHEDIVTDIDMPPLDIQGQIGSRSLTSPLGWSGQCLPSATLLSSFCCKSDRSEVAKSRQLCSEGWRCALAFLLWRSDCQSRLPGFLPSRFLCSPVKVKVDNSRQVKVKVFSFLMFTEAGRRQLVLRDISICSAGFSSVSIIGWEGRKVR